MTDTVSVKDPEIQDCGKVIKEPINRLTCRKVIDQIFHGNSCAPENRHSTQSEQVIQFLQEAGAMASHEGSP